MMKFTHDEFKKHLIDFNNIFKFPDENIKFKPCDYELWRKIVKAANNAISVVVVHNSRDKTIEALFNIGGKDSIITLGTSHDGSLGEYFYNISFPLKAPVALEAPIALSDTVNANMTKINANALEGIIINGIDFDLGTKADKVDVYNDISTLNDRIDNILVGKVKKYYEDVCLENQVFVKAENKETVGEYVKNNGGVISSMIRYEVGEGMEKRSENFAEEVAKQMQQ